MTDLSETLRNQTTSSLMTGLKAVGREISCLPEPLEEQEFMLGELESMQRQMAQELSARLTRTEKGKSWI